MKWIKWLLLFLGSITINDTSAQQSYCGTKSPDLSWENWFSKEVKKINATKLNRGFFQSYNIQVIVHILHNGDPIGSNENISAVQIQDQIDILNADFAGNNADISQAPPFFQSVLAGNTGIQFRLANYDPQGNKLAEPGINRINWDTKGWRNPASSNLNDTTTFVPYIDQEVKPNSIWPPDRYLNIWVSETKISGIGGFAYFPMGVDFNQSVETLTSSGIWINYRYFGNTGTSNSYGRTVTHEVGHYLGLYHTYELGCSGVVQATCADFGDRCCDTPPTTYSGFNCFNSNSPLNTCHQDVPNLVDMVMNHMSYSTCRYMFTKDQASRMQNIMASSPLRITLGQSCPDLRIIQHSLDVSSTIPGDSITLFFSEENIGIGSANTNYVSFHLSADEILTPGANGDLYLNDYQVTQVLASFTGTAVLSKKIKIPPNVIPGNYFLFFSADGSLVVSECNEHNNFASNPITISGSCADLTIVNQSATNNTVAPGGVVTINFKEKNIGGAVAAPNYVNFHLSEDDQFVTGVNGDIYLGEYAVGSAVASGTETAQVTTQITIPANTTPGTYYLFLAADGRWEVNECDNYNNNEYVMITVTGTGGSGSSQESIVSYRYWFNNKPAHAVTVNGNFGSNVYLQKDISTASLPSGLHCINIAFKNSTRWSSFVSSIFYKMPNATYPAGSAKYEYWTDNDYSSKTVNYLTNTTGLIILDSVLNEDIAPGLHSFSLRIKPDGKHWSNTITTLFYKLHSDKPEGISQYQYWWNNDTTRTVINVPSASNIVLLDSISTTGLLNGLHTLNIRFKPDGGHWSSSISGFYYKGITNDGNIVKAQYWFDGGFQNTVDVNITPMGNIVFEDSLLSSVLDSGEHTYGIRFIQSNGISSSVINGRFYKGNVNDRSICPGSNISFYAGATGQNYQWQVDKGNGYENIVASSVYAGSNADTLKLTAPPTSFYGYKYRCIVSGNPIVAYTLKFASLWMGTSNTSWHNTSNWACGSLPDENTDVVIAASTPYNTVINQPASCRTLTISSNLLLTVNSTLTIKK